MPEGVQRMEEEEGDEMGHDGHAEDDMDGEHL